MGCVQGNQNNNQNQVNKNVIKQNNIFVDEID